MRRVYKLVILFSCLLICAQANAQIIRRVAGMYDSTGDTGDGGPAILAQIGVPEGIALDTFGNLYISDNLNNVVRKVLTDGTILTVAGTGEPYGGYNGDSIPATSARLNGPIGIAVDPQGNIYIADNGNFRVRKIDTAGIITTVAGVGGIYGFGYSGDGGLAINAHMYVVGVAVDPDQNIFIADGNNYIRKVTHSTGIITTIAGSPLVGYSGDYGPAVNAALNNPTGVAVGPGSNPWIYIADFSNNVIRCIDNAAVPIMHTVAGNGTGGYGGDHGPARNAELKYPYAIALSPDGYSLYIADQSNNRIRKVTGINTPSIPPIITTVAGDGIQGYAGDGGLATAAELNQPIGVAVNASGGIFISDVSNEPLSQPTYGMVREVTNQAAISITATPGSNLCVGDSLEVSAKVTNPVLGETYQWIYNGVNVGTDSNFFISHTPASGDQVSCIVALPSTSVIATSDTITATVYPVLTPSLSILNDTNNVCFSQPVSFSLTSVNGGPSPQYEWLVNGQHVLTDSVFTYDPVNNDVVNCFLISDAICAIPDTATSNTIRMQVNADVSMQISIVAAFSDTVGLGEMATFIAQPTNEGSTPGYQWLVNGVPVPGATSNVFNTDSLTDEDVVSCVLRGSLLCTLPLTDTSASIVVNVVKLGVQSVSAGNSLVLLPNPNNGTFTIRGSLSGDETLLEVTDMLGQTVYTHKIPVQQNNINYTINLDGAVPHGMYMLHATSGTQTNVIPFVLGK